MSFLGYFCCFKRKPKIDPWIQLGLNAVAKERGIKVSDLNEEYLKALSHLSSHTTSQSIPPESHNPKRSAELRT